MNNLPYHQSDFAGRLLDWFYVYGRHNLPWQQLSAPFDPYPVWISEIMLQQTQVATVLGYYAKFMARFDNLQSLATAPLSDVIEYWVGLGYYARARNLHKCAQQLQAIIDQTGDYPTTTKAWEQLSGIGQSTAGAIVAMGQGGFGVICDGNVKRVLTRHFGIDEDIGKTTTNKKLWQLATALTPQTNSGHYAQAMMDLGATLCTRSRPQCDQCPVNTTCTAYKNGNQANYPVKAKKPPKPTHHSAALKIIHNNKLLWLKRPETGIWGALWCLPLMNINGNTDKNFNDKPSKKHGNQISNNEHILLEYLSTQFTKSALISSNSAQIRHTLTHFHWQLSPITLTVNENQKNAIDALLYDNGALFCWQKDIIAKPAAMDKLLAL